MCNLQAEVFSNTIKTFFDRRDRAAQNRAVLELAKFYLDRDQQPTMEMRRIGVFHYSTQVLRPVTAIAHDQLWTAFCQFSSTILNRFQEQQVANLNKLKDLHLAAGEKGYMYGKNTSFVFSVGSCQ